MPITWRGGTLAPPSSDTASLVPCCSVFTRPRPNCDIGRIKISRCNSLVSHRDMLSSFGQINRLDCPLRVVVVRAGSDGQAMVCRSAPLYMAEVRVGKNIDGKKAVSAALERSFLARSLCLRRYQSETI